MIEANAYKPIIIPDEQVEAWRLDQIHDAEQAEEQAKNGPFFANVGVTKESLLKYAAECRARAADPKTSLYACLKQGRPGRVFVKE